MAIQEKLTNIANAIREKTGDAGLLKLDEMPDAIASISGGGGDIPEEAFLITGSCQRKFCFNNWNWYIEKFGSKVLTRAITSCEATFDGSDKIQRIPFSINLDNGSKKVSLRNMFYNSYALSELPTIKSPTSLISSTEGMFYNCRNLREITKSSLQFNIAHDSDTAPSNMFFSCHSLRHIDQEFIDELWGTGYYSTSCPYSSMFSQCYTLDEITNFPVQKNTSAITSNVMSSFLSSASRIKRFTFALDENGQPQTWMAKSQTLDMSFYLGYNNSTTNITGYNSGITVEKRVNSDATYAALKDDPDWFATDINYARYNHDSAVETINSLPDTSAYLATAGGTNTIKFKGAAGSKTDGGAINTLTPEEIAVASAKGWTVTFA